MMSKSLQSQTLEYRWGVVDASEPEDIRLVRGYVTILERQSPTDAPLTYQLLFFHVDGRPMVAFSIEDFLLFTSAAALALDELGLPVDGGPLQLATPPAAVLVPLAVVPD